MIAGEGKVMLRLQPAMVGAAELGKGFQFDHVMFLLHVLTFSRAPHAPGLFNFVQAPKPPSLPVTFLVIWISPLLEFRWALDMPSAVV
jgi:hypothetical protein